jgi:hypothetical protein
MSDGITWINDQTIPRRTWGRNALVVDSGCPYGIRVRIEYSEELEEYGFERIKAIAGEAVEKLKVAGPLSDPANPKFEYPN